MFTKDELDSMLGMAEECERMLRIRSVVGVTASVKEQAAFYGITARIVDERHKLIEAAKVEKKAE